MVRFGIKDEDLISKRNSARKSDSEDAIVANPILSIEAGDSKDKSLYGFKQV